MWYFCSDHGIIRTLDLPIYITRVKVRLLFRKCHWCGSHYTWFRGVLALMTAAKKKTSLKKWICAASLLFHLTQCLWCWQIFLELNSKRLYLSSEKKILNRFLVFTSFVRHEIRMFHVIILQQWQRNVEKSVMYMQTCCLANLYLLLSCYYCCRCCSSC